MKIVTWIVILPITEQQFEAAEDYTVAKRTIEDLSDKGGIMLKSKEETTVNGIKGYTALREYKVRDRIPGIIKWALPKGITEINEKCLSTFPERNYEYWIPQSRDLLRMKMQSVTKPYKYGDQIEDEENDVSFIDVLNWDPNPKDQTLSLSEFECQEAGIEKFPKSTKNHKKHIPEWVKDYKGEMSITYKRLQVEFNVFGVSSTVESILASTIMPNIIAETSRDMILHSPEWTKMNREQVSEYEKESYDHVNSELIRNNCT